jgi:integrase
MVNTLGTQAKVIELFPRGKKKDENSRKSGLNYNRNGSVRKLNGKVYIDFIYLGERVRESSGLRWNEKNAKHVRGQLDKIIVQISSGSFRFADVFPKSKRAEYFTEKELHVFGGNKTPDQVLFGDYVWIWYKLLKDSGRIAGRTLWGYKSHITQYLEPYFGEMPFANLNKSTFDKFVSWAKRRKYQKKTISNNTVNKVFVPLKMICKDASIEYGWGGTYNPFYGFKRLPENDSYENLFPFSLDEQHKIIQALPDHWKPYFDTAFKIGLRQGEQIALRLEDIDWERDLLHVRRAITRDENGKIMIGKTKNRYSRRTIRLLPVMRSALEEQKMIYDNIQGNFFFSSPTGAMVDTSHLRKRVWKPALKKAGLDYREMKQTRHSFATNALSCGENPLWIARVLGHRDADMVIRVYGKFIENAGGFKDGNNLNDFYKGKTRKDE